MSFQELQDSFEIQISSANLFLVDNKYLVLNPPIHQAPMNKKIDDSVFKKVLCEAGESIARNKTSFAALCGVGLLAALCHKDIIPKEGIQAWATSIQGSAKIVSDTVKALKEVVKIVGES
ncbi:unnamed protein product [Cuscuta campestris]|uniref:Uncharacterized protein n=1 Tax=Cuscuta campestris TaxID=132261 RepID=A0A484L8K3_9ASTE|nr:unnamed protein product [Cuscuta campestris]